MKTAQEIIAILPGSGIYTPDLSDYGEAMIRIEELCALGASHIDLSNMAFMVDTNYTKEARYTALHEMLLAGIPVSKGGKWSAPNMGQRFNASVPIETHPLWIDRFADDKVALGAAVEAAALGRLRTLTMRVDRASTLTNFQPGSTVPSGIKTAWKRDGLPTWRARATSTLTALGFTCTSESVSW